MEQIFRLCLFIAGIINTIPAILAFFPSRISDSYGIEIPNSNYELLLRHRAALFGIVGGIMLYSAITRKNYSMAVLIGLVSMISFIVLLKFATGEINSELHKVMKVDIVGIVALAIGCVFYKFKS